MLLVTPAAALFLVRERALPAEAPSKAAAGTRLPPLGVPIALLLGAQLFALYSAGTANLGSSLAMNAASYHASQISRINAAAGLVGLPRCPSSSAGFPIGWDAKAFSSEVSSSAR